MYTKIIANKIKTVVLYFFAIRGIKKEDALVRSADRLR